MPAPYAEMLFWTAAVATGAAQVLILRSTFRVLRNAERTSRRAWEWVWAVLPAASLVVLFAWTWQTMRQQPAAHDHSRTPAVPHTQERT
jgi:hypothetical protein